MQIATPANMALQQYRIWTAKLGVTIIEIKFNINNGLEKCDERW
jgi:hypothetical protein